LFIAKHLTNLIAWFVALIALTFYICMAVGSVNQNNPLQDFHVFYSSSLRGRVDQESYKPIIIPQNKWAKEHMHEIKKYENGAKKFKSKNEVSVDITPLKKIKEHDKGLYSVGVNLNPPFFSLLVEPLTHLPYHRAYYVWVMLAALMIYLSLRLVVSTDEQFRKKSRYVGMAFFLLMTYSPTLMNASCGQLGALFTFVLVCAWFLGKKKHYVGMTVVLAALAAIKLFVAFFVFWLLIKKQYKLTAVFIISGLVFTFLPLLLGFTPHNYVDYVQTIQRLHWVHRIAFANWNVSLLGPFARINNFFAPGVNNKIGHLIKLPFYVLFAGVLWGYIYRLRQMDFYRDFDLMFVLTFLTMFLVCPLSWAYYLISLVLVYFILLNRAIKSEDYLRYILTLSLGLFLCGIYLPFMPHLQSLTVFRSWVSIVRGSLPFAGFVIITVVAYRLSSPQELAAPPVTLCDKKLRFAIFTGYVLALIPGLYTMNHMMRTAMSIFMFFPVTT
jgi:hypothetical protein